MDWFNGIYTSSYRVVLGSVYFVVLDREVAAEITQEAFLRLWQHRDRLSPESSARAWLIRVAVNLAVSHRRSLAALWRRKVDIPEPIDPGSEAVDNVEVARVRQALLRLRQIDRAVLSLRFDEGLAFAEIGVILGRPENTVKTRFHRSLARLRRALDASASSEVDSTVKEGSNG
jgi:RNA polymerase sigma-70 factor (ECF subfamily)